MLLSCLSSPLPRFSLSLCGRQMWACVFIYLFRRPFGFEDFLSPAELHDDTKTVTRLICDHVGSPLLVLFLWAEETHIKHDKSTFLQCEINLNYMFMSTQEADSDGVTVERTTKPVTAVNGLIPSQGFTPTPRIWVNLLPLRTQLQSSGWNLPLWNVKIPQPLHILSQHRRGFTLQPDISNMASILVLSKGQFAVYMILYEKHSCSQFHAINPVIKLRKSSLLPAANLRDAL